MHRSSPMVISTPDVNISLEPHLLGVLRPVSPLLPQELAHQLDRYLTDSPSATIPYQTLLNLSQWSRTEQAQKLLKSNNLDIHSYSMIALLAGTTTSPERKFGSYAPPKDPEDIEAERIGERKTIAVLLNALLSIGCVGYAAWWAGEKTGWKPEWRALFALFAAMVVAIAEAGLYMIWRSRQSATHTAKSKRLSARHKKVDPGPTTEHTSNDVPQAVTVSANGMTEVSETLRLRR